jgi:hypothetical protein
MLADMRVNIFLGTIKRQSMAPIFVQDLAQCIDKLSLSEPTNVGKGGMTVCNLKLDGKHVVVKLAKDLETITTPFEPSVFQGTGQEARKGILFNIPQDVFEGFAAVEEFCRQALEESTPKVQSLWSSSLRPNKKYPATLKAKINVSGDRAANFYNEANEPTEQPENWKHLPCDAVLQVRGCYIQKQGVGMLLEVTHLQYGAEPSAVEEVSPF